MTLTRLSFFAKEYSLCVCLFFFFSNVNHLLIVCENAAIPYGLSRCYQSCSSVALKRCGGVPRCSPCRGPAHPRGQRCPVQRSAFACTRTSQIGCAGGGTLYTPQLGWASSKQLLRSCSLSIALPK